jgi:hypothetical protein
MGVMGLGENGLKVSKVSGGLDVAICPPLQHDKREGMEHVPLSQKTLLLHTSSHNQIS